MVSTTPKGATCVTAEQLLRMPDDGYRYELIAGELRMMSPAGWRHGAAAGKLHGLLAPHVVAHNLGAVLAAETGFLLSRDPDTVRAPDIAFVAADRWHAAPPRESYWPGAPDLAVEVVSPSDTFQEVQEKVEAWLRAGARMVWVVSPQPRDVTVYRPARESRTLSEEDQLSGEDVLPGFHCRVGEIFSGL
jgi:Uma2 family endonuclease